MKRSVLVSMAVFLLMAFAGGAAAREKINGDSRLAVMDDPIRFSFSRDAANLDRKKIRQAIDTALAYRNWRVVKDTPGRIEVTTTVNGKHTVNAQITYDDVGYEFAYIDSIDLMYQEVGGSTPPVRAIHRNYNAWVRQLIATINRFLGDAPGGLRGTRAVNTVSAAGGGAPPPVVPSAAFAALDNLDAVPVNGEGRERYTRFLALPAPRIFTVGPDGTFKIFIGEKVMAKALKHCRNGKCWLYAVDDQVVWNADPAKRIPAVAVKATGE
jgi:hypothetical protein